MIAMIPARAGSKRIPGKNIKMFHGAPLLGRAILLAKESGIFGEVVVSSEDEGILSIASGYGAIPHLRPTELAVDTADTECVVIDTWQHYPSDCICCMYTSSGIFITDKMLWNAYGHYLSVKNRHVITYLKSDPDRDAGQFYFLNMAVLQEQYSKGIEILQQPHDKYLVDAIDINTDEDWKRAEEWWEANRA